LTLTDFPASEVRLHFAICACGQLNPTQILVFLQVLLQQ